MKDKIEELHNSTIERNKKITEVIDIIKQNVIYIVDEYASLVPHMKLAFIAFTLLCLGGIVYLVYMMV